MADFTYNESNHRFTDPIRFFKKNDPYYYEVDNIPLKQIHENMLWLKDQVLASPTLTKVGRSDLDELRPYVNGSDNIVNVRPGRFSGRVNDAYNLEALAHLSQILGTSPGDMDEWSAQAWNDTLLINTVTKFFEYQTSNILNLNGLAERVFSHPCVTPDQSPNWLTGTRYDRTGAKSGSFPATEVITWIRRISGPTTYNVNGYDDVNLFTWLSTLETYFVKRWRGIFRTAICDLSEEASIEIEPFSPDDYYYIDENGNKVTITGPTQRIDLLFLYTKPVDTSSTTIAKFVNQGEDATPTTIYAPQLGVVRGAGVGVSKKDQQSFSREIGVKSDGTPMILAAASDELSTYNGFDGIHGSFPSPDDLMNLAPSIMESLQAGSFQLIGQSILPIAYVVVKKNASLNSLGNPIITSSDIIDIRPFFRTAELTYNERAGLAAAYPAVSLANPVVGKFQVDLEIKNIAKVLRQEFGGGATGPNSPKIVGAGYVLGGAYFGVESVFMNHYRQTVFQGNATWEEVREYTRSKLGFASQVLIPDLPDWDVASWAYTNGSLPSVGLYPNDYIEVFYTDGEVLEKGCFRDIVTNPITQGKINYFGTDNIDGKHDVVSMLYCRKEFTITRPSWMVDYHVEANLLNCIPLSCRAYGENSQGMASPAGIWITKAGNKFTINCAWVANDLNPIGAVGSKRYMMAGSQPYGANPLNNRSGHWFAGIAAMSPELGVQTDARYLKGASKSGPAIYPSIQFKIIGYPSWSGWAPNTNGRNPVINLS